MLFFAFLHPVILWGYLIVFNKLIGAAISAAIDACAFHTMGIDLWVWSPPQQRVVFYPQLGNLIRMCEFRGINVFLELPKPKKLKVKLKLE